MKSIRTHWEWLVPIVVTLGTLLAYGMVAPKESATARLSAVEKQQDHDHEYLIRVDQKADRILEILLSWQK